MNDNPFNQNIAYNINAQQKKSKVPLYIGIGAICLLIITIIVFTIVRQTDNNQSEYNYYTVREDTKTLRIYATLKEEMTAEELEKAAKTIDPEAEISFFENGTGQIKIPGEDDYILFDHALDIEAESLAEIVEDESAEEDNEETTADITEDTEDDELSDEEDDALDDQEHLHEDEVTTRFEINTVAYQPSDIVKEIRYAYPYADSAFVIRYSSEEDAYEVSDLMETYTFPTKQEAIDSYLAPVVE